MKLDLDGDAMKSLVSEAIFQSFSEESRNTLVKQALQNLLQPVEQGSGYNKTIGKSPLQTVFDDALAWQARDIVRNAIETRPEIIAALNEIIDLGLKKFMTDKKEEIAENIAQAIRKAITGDRY